MFNPIDIYAYKDRQKGLPETDVFGAFCIVNAAYTKSQNFQDLWVLYERERLGIDNNGYFVDFGAYDGVDGSNTLLLQKLGWSGVLIEPHPVIYESLLKNRLSPNILISNRAIFDKDDEVVSFISTVDNLQYSTIQGFENSDYNGEQRKANTIVSVETAKLNTILKKTQCPKYIDYMSVDTEGTELIILTEFFKNTDYKIHMLTIEHNFDTVQRDKIHRLMTENGYIRKFEEFSRWDDFYILGKN